MDSPTEVARQSKAEVLRGNTFGILGMDELSVEERKNALINLIPVALEIEKEARDTIQRLNEEIEELRRNNGQQEQ